MTRLARSPIKDDDDEIRQAVAMLSAMIRRDIEGVQVIGKYADTTALTFGLASIVFDALSQDATTNIEAYLHRLFERLER